MRWSEQTGDGYSAIARSIASSPRDPEELPRPRTSRLNNGTERWLTSDHAHPKHRLVSDIDVVFVDEVEPAAVVDPKDGQARWHGAQGFTVLHKEWHDVRGDQQAAARVDMKSPTVNTVRVDVLDQTRLAGRRVDRIHREIVFSAGRDALAREFRGCGGAIDCVDEAPVGMHVNGAGNLASPDIAWLGQGVLADDGCRRQRVPG